LPSLVLGGQKQTAPVCVGPSEGVYTKKKVSASLSVDGAEKGPQRQVGLWFTGVTKGISPLVRTSHQEGTLIIPEKE